MTKKQKTKSSEDLHSKAKAKSTSAFSESSGVGFKIKQGTLSKLKWKLSDFKPAKYNPRYITDSRLQKLSKSIRQFGDLSGVTFNARTNTLVSGHQRLRSIDGLQTTVHTKKHIDKHGTVEIGTIEARTKDGAVITIPLRIVDWSNDKVEKAANIAANAHGGEFDKEKLQTLLTELDVGSFDVELLGLDPLSIASLALPKDAAAVARNQGMRNTNGEFREVSPNDFEKELKCTCPKCGYKF